MGTSAVEVTNVSKLGLWLLIHDKEVFLPFEKFPWFQDAPIGKVVHVELPSEQHLYWPELDVDLEVESVLHPERYPLVSRVHSSSGVAILPLLWEDSQTSQLVHKLFEPWKGQA